MYERDLRMANFLIKNWREVLDARRRQGHTKVLIEAFKNKEVTIVCHNEGYASELRRLGLKTISVHFPMPEFIKFGPIVFDNAAVQALAEDAIKKIYMMEKYYKERIERLEDELRRLGVCVNFLDGKNKEYEDENSY